MAHTTYYNPIGNVERAILVEYDYTPEQKETLTDPSWPAEVELTCFKWKDNGKEVPQVIVDQLDLGAIEEEIFEEIYSYDSDCY